MQSRRSGTSTWYRLDEQQRSHAPSSLWQLISQALEDPLVKQDAMRLPAVLRSRHAQHQWVDSVAGDMERHYSPGRTWESTARVLAELDNTDAIIDIASGDGVLADLLKHRCQDYLCVDLNPLVVKAGAERLTEWPQVRFARGDMHQLPVKNDTYPVALVLHALSFSICPEQVVLEAARVLKPGGRLLLVTLAAHHEAAVVEAFDHHNQGFAASELTRWAAQAGLNTVSCGAICTERRPPYFQVLMLHATKP